ncbi:MAG: two pore domain potassium channel family protein [Hyphomicrobium sp.]|nr:two pore domain potassium channel family protein [Hyphomicrobium sp.]
MIVQMILGSVMIILTTVVQGVFMITAIEMLRRRVTRKVTRSDFESTLLLSYFVLWLFVATIIEVWAWAMLYRLIGAVGSTEEALYFSTTTFTTLGFGDITLDDQWRLLSSFEGANGLLMFGWSTALIFAAVQKVYGYERRFSKDDSN